jgi:hypothetical protein
LELIIRCYLLIIFWDLHFNLLISWRTYYFVITFMAFYNLFLLLRTKLKLYLSSALLIYRLLLFFLFWFDRRFLLFDYFENLKKVEGRFDPSPESYSACHWLDNLIWLSFTSTFLYLISKHLLIQIKDLCAIINVGIFKRLNFEIFNIIEG